ERSDALETVRRHLRRRRPGSYLHLPALVGHELESREMCLDLLRKSRHISLATMRIRPGGTAGRRERRTMYQPAIPNGIVHQRNDRALINTSAIAVRAANDAFQPRRNVAIGFQTG